MIARIMTFILVAYAAFYFGFFFGERLAPWQYDVSGKAFAEYHKTIDFYMSQRMQVLVKSCMVVMLIFLALEWKNRRNAPFKLIAVAFLLQIGIVVISVNSNVAMNPAMNAWDPNHLPANWGAIRTEWMGYHVRNTPLYFTLAILIFLACYYYWTRPKVSN